MDKQLFEHAQSLWVKYRDGANLPLKQQYLKNLHDEYQFGQSVFPGDYLCFNQDDWGNLIKIVKQELDVDLRFDCYPELQSRNSSAVTDRNEKSNSFPVSKNYILVNSLIPLSLNKKTHPVSPFNSFGIYINADQISSIEHKQIVLVENLAVMAVLDKLVIPERLKGALWLYRGDVRPQQNSAKAYQFFRRFKESHQLICFSDFDPAGIQIALTCDAKQWLTIKQFEVANMPLQGAENKFYDQRNACKFLDNYSSLPNKAVSAYTYMKQNRKSLQQEHMFAHLVELTLFPL